MQDLTFKKLAVKILFGSFMAFLFSYIIYFGFISNYTLNLYSTSSFKLQYDHDVYAYRLIGKKLLLELQEVLEDNFQYEDAKSSFSELENRIKTLDPGGTLNFYFAYFILNTFFLILCSILFVFLLENSLLIVSESEKILILSLAILLICLSQFVLVPYDTLSYFFQLLFLVGTLSYLRNQSYTTLLVLGVILGISTLNRESSALSLSAFASVLIMFEGRNAKVLRTIGMLSLGFIIPYVGLRFFIESETTLVNQMLLTENLNSISGKLGLMVWPLLGYISWILAAKRINKKAILLFHVLSLPYLVFCILTGAWFEIRLYIPLFLTSLILARISFPEQK